MRLWKVMSPTCFTCRWSPLLMFRADVRYMEMGLVDEVMGVRVMLPLHYTSSPQGLFV